MEEYIPGAYAATWTEPSCSVVANVMVEVHPKGCSYVLYSEVQS